jgi:hypothetical protein
MVPSAARCGRVKMAHGSAAVRAYRGRDLAAGLTGRGLALTALFGVALALGGCSSFAGFVSDTWPTWAGGIPKDAPPRPGAPGYEEFIAHQHRQDAAVGGAAAPGAAAQAGTPAPGAPGTTGTTTPTATAAPAANPAAGRTAPQQFPPAYARPDDRSTTQGGLY